MINLVNFVRIIINCNMYNMKKKNLKNKHLLPNVIHYQTRFHYSYHKTCMLPLYAPYK